MRSSARAKAVKAMAGKARAEQEDLQKRLAELEARLATREAARASAADPDFAGS
jgi:BMFP domain-containing protein YqiC